MLVGALATGQEPASNLCNGHNHDKNKELFARPFIDVKVEVNGQAVTAGDELLDLGYACVGGMIEFKVTASDNDALDCDIHETTERVSNYMRNTTVQVKISMDADTVYCILPLISPQGSDMTFTRTWTNGWTIPPQAVGRTLLFEFVGLVSDVKCDAPLHKASHDPDCHLNAPDEGYRAEATVFEVESIDVLPKGTPEGYELPEPVCIGAGAMASDAHQADVVIQALPAEAGLPVRIRLLNGRGREPGRDAKLVTDSVTVVGGGEAVTVQTGAGGKIAAVLTSSDVLNNCTIQACARERQVDFTWDRGRKGVSPINRYF
jgi:hypothetical protein